MHCVSIRNQRRARLCVFELKSDQKSPVPTLLCSKPRRNFLDLENRPHNNAAAYIVRFSTIAPPCGPNSGSNAFTLRGGPKTRQGIGPRHCATSGHVSIGVSGYWWLRKNPPHILGEKLDLEISERAIETALGTAVPEMGLGSLHRGPRQKCWQAKPLSGLFDMG